MLYQQGKEDTLSEEVLKKAFGQPRCGGAVVRHLCVHLRVAKCECQMLCQSVNCQQIHLVCLCPNERRVPVEDRFYLRDQRAKVGTHGGAMQMVGPDRIFNAQIRLVFEEKKIT